MLLADAARERQLLTDSDGSELLSLDDGSSTDTEDYFDSSLHFFFFCYFVSIIFVISLLFEINTVGRTLPFYSLPCSPVRTA